MLTLAFIASLLAQSGEFRTSRESKVYSANPSAAARGGGSFNSIRVSAGFGAKLPYACSCAPLSTTTGAPITATRASNATCSKKGLASTGIENGDLVICSTNQPRTAPDPRGTLGIYAERSVTNSLVYSEQLDQWSAEHSGSPDPGAITVTANYATAPDGAQTAERLQIPAASGTGISRLYTPGISVTSSKGVWSFYIKGNGTSGTFDFKSTYAVSWAPGTPCTYVADTWTRCQMADTAATTSTLYLGVDAAAGIATAHDILIWGVQYEVGGWNVASSYIPTTASTATRSADVIYFTLPDGWTPLTMSVSLTPLMGATSNTYVPLTMSTDATHYYRFASVAGTDTVQTVAVVGTSRSFTSTATMTLGSPNNLIYNIIGGGTDLGNSVNGTVGSGSVTSFTPLVTSSTKVYLGNSTGASHMNGITTNVCVSYVAGACK